MRFRDELRKNLAEKSNIPENLISLLPSGYFEIDRKIIIKLKSELLPYASEVAEEVARIVPRAEAVWLRKGQISGKYREPSGLVHLWGETDTDVIAKENGVRYKFDFTKIMFAKGNVHERGLLPKKIKENEIIVDMFAGIGYFSLGMAKTGKPEHIYAIEWNPLAFKYLQENITLNHVEDIITPYHADCREKVLELAAQGIRADRVIMGLLPAPVNSIEPALKLIPSSGTIFVYEGVEPEESTTLFDEFSAIARNYKFHTDLLERRLVKAFKPHEYHVVLEILVTPT